MLPLSTFHQRWVWHRYQEKQLRQRFDGPVSRSCVTFEVRPIPWHPIVSPAVLYFHLLRVYWSSRDPSTILLSPQMSCWIGCSCCRPVHTFHQNHGFVSCFWSRYLWLHFDRQLWLSRKMERMEFFSLFQKWLPDLQKEGSALLEYWRFCMTIEVNQRIDRNELRWRVVEKGLHK